MERKKLSKEKLKRGRPKIVLAVKKQWTMVTKMKWTRAWGWPSSSQKSRPKLITKRYWEHKNKTWLKTIWIWWVTPMVSKDPRNVSERRRIEGCKAKATRKRVRSDRFRYPGVTWLQKHWWETGPGWRRAVYGGAGNVKVAKRTPDLNIKRRRNDNEFHALAVQAPGRARRTVEE